MKTPDSCDEGRLAPDSLAHWVLKSARPAELREWYVTVLGARVVFADRRLTFLTWDSEHHRLAIVALPPILKPLTRLTRYSRKLYGLDHIAFGYRDLRRLLGTYRRLREAGIRPVWCVNHGPTTSIYYEDPDGNRLELQCDNFRTAEELAAFEPTFRRNAIGVNFDPDLLLEKLEAGVPISELLRQGSATPAGQAPVAGWKTINWRTL